MSTNKHDIETSVLCLTRVAMHGQDPAVTSGNLDRVEALLMKLDKKLAGKHYLVDNRFTVADVAIGGDLLVISTCMPYVIPRFNIPYKLQALCKPLPSLCIGSFPSCS